MFEGLLADWQKPEKPDEINPNYGVSNQQVYNARMGALTNAGLTLLLASQRMAPEQRSQMLAQLANAPQQFQQSISQQMQNRLLGAKVAELDDENARKKKLQELMNDPEAYKKVWGYDPSGLDLATAMKVNEKIATDRASPDYSYQDLGDRIAVINKSDNTIAGYMPKGVSPGDQRRIEMDQKRFEREGNKGQYVQGADGNYVMLPEYGGLPRPVMGADGKPFAGKPDTGALSIDKDAQGNVVVIDKVRNVSSLVAGPDGQPMKAPADLSAFSVQQGADGRYMIINKANGTSANVNDAQGQPAMGAPPNSKDPTEDQNKAAGWFKQANKAFADMEAAIAADPNAAEFNPGAAGAESILPGFIGETVGNKLRSNAQQRYKQASEAFAEAALRAATGAGINKDEIIQKAKELTPRPGDTPAVREQKRQSMEMYLDALRVRAGRALQQPSYQGIGAGTPPSPGGASAPAANRTVVRTGTITENGRTRRVNLYSDGTSDYAD